MSNKDTIEGKLEFIIDFIEAYIKKHGCPGQHSCTYVCQLCGKCGDDHEVGSDPDCQCTKCGLYGVETSPGEWRWQYNKPRRR